ncbi:MAG: patatin-like phospholipase family protein [Bacteroidia bacterium]
MKTGLVLSGGGARGFAHVGVVRALQEKNISWDMISGTSAGAMIGAFLADGFSPAEILEVFREYEQLGIFNFLSWRPGLLSLDKLKRLLETNLRSKTFEQLNMPFFVTATDYDSGKQKVFSSGDLVQPILAATSIPLLFPAVYIEGIPYADGGISSNLPVEPLEGRVDKLIGVYVNPHFGYSEKESSFEKVDRTMHMMIRYNMEVNSKKCDLYIEPPDLKNYGMFDSKKTDEIVSIGYEYARSIVKESANLF